MNGKILIADTDPVQRRLLTEIISGFGCQTVHASNGTQALSMLTSSHANIDLAILEMNMPDPDGLSIIEKLHAVKIHLPIIIQTNTGGIETIVKAMRAGAIDFFVKPISTSRLQQSISSAISKPSFSSVVGEKKSASANSSTFDDIISSSAKMAQVIRLAKMAAKSSIPVIIEGETGVGKELLARAIQSSSSRARQSFVTVNCGALPENLVESVLFGHKKGSFTGATNNHTGKFVEANGGTLFLDEVGELPLATQIKLLRALQEGEVDPIGAQKPQQTDFRLISATNLNLEKQSKNGKFRKDLYYRLNVFPIMIPALRERQEEIPQLAQFFLAKFSHSENRPDIKTIDPQALRLLSNYDWPGNIRQLENTIYRAVVLCEGSRLLVSHFPQIIPGISMADGSDTSIDDPVTSPANPPLVSIVNAPSISFDPNDTTRLVTNEGQVKELEEIESEVILFAIELYDGKLSEVAKRLGIGRSTLYRRLKELGISNDLQDSTRSA